MEYKYLNRVNSPADLRKLDVGELPALCAEIRDFMIGRLAVNPGHLASSLGAVELAVAVHYVFDTPNDKLIWDVGHQAYAHKILTGRREAFETNRKLGGIGGFPRRSESEYDAFIGGHASVSVSAALGIAIGNQLQITDYGLEEKVVAIIGDGAMTGGLAFEGLNNAGASNADILVILNDNNMSISPNVGAMKKALLKMTASKRYNRFKQLVWDAMRFVPRLRRIIRRIANTTKHFVFQRSNLFESLGFRYFGPVDGNNVEQLVRVLGDLKHICSPRLLHVITVKGKGYEPAETTPSIWHAPGKFDPVTGEIMVSRTVQPPRYQEVFGRTLAELARVDERIVGITPAMLTGCSMDIFQAEFPERCFDVGIAEGHAVTFSAGLAVAGCVPFCNIYSSFVQRAYDNIIHDVALQNLQVCICLDRAGLVGEDGATHHGAYDLVALRTVPNLIIAAPRNEAELRNLMFTASRTAAPFVIRYPRGCGEGVELGEFTELPIGKAEVLREGEDVALLTIGTTAVDVSRAASRAANDGISVHHIDLRWAKPLDYECLREIGRRFRKIITVEDGSLSGGVGSAVEEFLLSEGFSPEITRLGIPDKFIEHGTIAELKQLCGYDEYGIYDAIKKAP